MPRPSDAPLRILVYSDNPRTREQVQLALGKRVHPELPELSYLEVATAPMVIKQMDAGGFDLVLLDLNLGDPVLDGLAVCREIRAMPGYLPVIMLTVRDEAADKVIGL